MKNGKPQELNHDCIHVFGGGPVDGLIDGIPATDLIALTGPLEPDALVLVGSAPESLASRLSDLHLIVIGDRVPRHSRTALARKFVTITGYDTRAVSALLETLQSAAMAIQKASRLEKIDEDKLQMLNLAEVSLLHNLRTGQILRHPERAAVWRECLDALPDFLVLYYLGTHFNCREDVIGQAKYGDPFSAVWMLNPAADMLAGAMLASAGETNPDPRCRPALLRRYEPQLGAARVDRLLQYLLPGNQRASAFAVVQHALSFFDLAIIELFSRRPAISNVIVELRKRVKFVMRFDELPEDPARGVL